MPDLAKAVKRKLACGHVVSAVFVHVEHVAGHCFLSHVSTFAAMPDIAAEIEKLPFRLLGPDDVAIGGGWHIKMGYGAQGKPERTATYFEREMWIVLQRLAKAQKGTP